MIASGVSPLDERLGGLVPKRTYVLTGAPGTGKTIACLEFANGGLEAGETVVMLTNDDPTDVVAQGQFLGIDLEQRLADERLVLLRYQLDFARRFARAATPEIAFDELRALIGGVSPARIVIDSVAPFLETGSASGAGIAALASFIDSLGATAMVTYPADLAGLYDRRLEPLVQRAAAIVHFSCERDRGHRMEIRKVRFGVRSTAPASFVIEPGIGIVPLADAPRRRAGDATADAGSVLVLDSTNDFPAELLAMLRARYDVIMRSTLSHAFADLAAGSGAVLVHVRRDTVDDALTLVRELRRAGNRAPIMLVTQFTLRGDDRARALRAGADEFLTGELHPGEFLLRVESAIERGHRRKMPEAEIEVPVVTHPLADGRAEPLSRDEFRRAVNAHLAGDRAPFFTLVTIAARDGGDNTELATEVLRAIRLESGDLVGSDARGVSVYLHSARRKDVAPFMERVRERWRRAGHGELTIDVAAWPLDEQRVTHVLERQEAT